MIKYFSLTFIFIFCCVQSYASDHADTPLHIEEGRNDARITDLFAFTNGDSLVLIMGVDPTVSVGASTYTFPTDVEYIFNIDNDSEVTSEGIIVEKSKVYEDIVIKIRFNDEGIPEVNGKSDIVSVLTLPFLVLFSCSSGDEVDVEDAITNFFSGPREDPFIRGPRIGQNIAAIVIEIPLDMVVKNNGPLLIWANTRVDGLPGDFQERAGRPLTSMFNDALNFIHPSEDFSDFGIEPDVLVLDTSLPSGYPNGRVLEDDVVDIICPGICDMLLANDTPFPSENDVPFLDEFPYLSPPH